MDEHTLGAARLLSGLHDAAQLFGAYGYELYLAHQSVGWRRMHSVGKGVDPLAVLGVVFSLGDAENTEVCSGVCLWLRDQQFVIQADVTVDDPVPEAAGNQRFLLDLPEVRTASLDECLTVLHDHTVRLCAYTSVLDELGVPRTVR